MKIQACPRCGSRDISTGTMGSGVTFGVTSWNFTCKNCNYRGQPLEFDNEEAYNKFLKGLAKERQAEKEDEEEPIDTNQETIKDKQFMEIVKEAEQDTRPLCDEHPFQHKKWWPEIIISVILSAIITYIWFSPNLITYMDNIETLISSVLFFIFWIFIVLLFLVIIEYFGVCARRNLKSKKP